MKRSRSNITKLSTLSPTRTLSQSEPIELLKHIGSPKRTYVGNNVNLGPGRRISKGKKHSDIVERINPEELRAFGQQDPEVVAAQLAAKIKREKQEELDKIPKELVEYDRKTLYPKWMRKDERFARIFATPMLPEFVAIRKDPIRRHDDDKMALTKWLGTHSLFTHFSTFKRRALGGITKLHKFTTGDIICSHGGTRHKLFIVITGKVDITSPALGALGTLNVGDSVGNVESHPVMEKFAESHKGEYDIVLKAATKETHVAVILRSAYRDTMAEFEDAEMWENIRFMRKEVQLFRDWSKSRLMVLAKSLETWNVEKGEIIVEQSRPSDYMFFVVEGECAVQKRIHFTRDNKIPTGVTGVFDLVRSETNMDVEIHIVKSGDFFGHHSFLTKEAVEQRRAVIEANKRRSKGAQKIASKFGNLGDHNTTGTSIGGSGFLSGLSASVASLQLLNKEKEVANSLPRSATVVARTHCKLLALSHENFWDMMTYGDTIDQLMQHIKTFKTQDEVIRGFDEHKRLRKIWENAKDAVQYCAGDSALNGIMDFEKAMPRPMRITVAGEAFRHKGEMMGGHFDVPAAVLRRRRQKSKILSKLKKSAKMGSLLARLSKSNKLGAVGLSGGKLSLFSAFGDAIKANNIKKLLSSSSSNKSTKRKKRKEGLNAKDIRYQQKQATKRREESIKEAALLKKNLEKRKHQSHRRSQMSKGGKGPEFHMPSHSNTKSRQFETRANFAADDEWEKMMEEEKKKLIAKKKKK